MFGKILIFKRSARRSFGKSPKFSCIKPEFRLLHQLAKAFLNLSLAFVYFPIWTKIGVTFGEFLAELSGLLACEIRHRICTIERLLFMDFGHRGEVV